jgi:hypothetical protein
VTESALEWVGCLVFCLLVAGFWACRICYFRGKLAGIRVCRSALSSPLPEETWRQTELEAMRALTVAVNEMLLHPEARVLILRARRAANPKAFIPELDVRL